MFQIRKKLVTDENLRPVAVQIDYADWLRIERALSADSNERTNPLLGGVDDSRTDTVATDLAPYSGALRLTEEPLEYQRRARSEWP